MIDGTRLQNAKKWHSMWIFNDFYCRTDLFQSDSLGKHVYVIETIKGDLNPGLFNPMVQKFMVVKSGVEKSEVEMSFNHWN